MSKPLNILIVEDSEDDALLLLRELRRGGYEPVSERVETAEAMRAALERGKWDIVISDYILPKFSGSAALSLLNESGIDLPFIIVSGNIGEDIAVEAMRAGAHDYILKGNLRRLVPAVERELRDAGVRRDRKRIEEERVRLSAAVEAVLEAIVVTDAAGVIQYVNSAFEAITGYARDEAVGRDLHMLDSGKHDEKFHAGMREALARDGVWNGQLINRKKDGALYYEECTTSPVRDQSGEVVNYVSVKRDITEKLRLESIAESVNTMESIGYVFSGVRHEIGNPVNSLNMIMGILRSKLDTLPLENVREYLTRMSDQIGRIEYLLRSLKSFNMHETQEPQNVRVSSFLENLMPLVTEDFGKNGITIETTTAPDAEWMRADPRALQQVLLNVFTNASDAVTGRENPKISINVERLGGMVRIRMKDNGCGIPEGKLGDIFRPFYTTKAHGTGLGLVLAKKMLARMNGTISIESRKDVGTIVNIAIPEGNHGTIEGT